MSSDATVAPPAPPRWQDRTLLQWVGTSNPFYVISAGLFLAGLRLSFGGQTRDLDAWALMTGMAGYTLLLAAAALLLVRFAAAWDDLRTVLLLVVLMFLATSVTLDELLVLKPEPGRLFYLAGLLFAVAVSEGVLRGIRLRLPAGFRVPYYLTLALFFLYPLALAPFVPRPRSEELLWGLFGFSPAAGLVFLTLLPAVRQGPGYVRDSGSPWAWPFYPWSLFVFLGAAVAGRAFLLCWSFHLVGGGNLDRVIFGPYFLVPFGLAVGVLLLELGIVARSGVTEAVALAVPAGLAALAAVGHRDDPVYREFLGLFTARLGGTPLFLALLAAAGFYLYAALRRVPAALDALTAALAALAVVGPGTLTFGDLTPARPLPLAAAAVVQLALAVRRRSAWRWLAVGVGLAVAISAVVPVGGGSTARLLVAIHLVLAAALAVGAVFDTPGGRVIRALGIGLVLLASLAVSLAPFGLPAGAMPWSWAVYPVVMAAVLVAYGVLLRHGPAVVVAGAAFTAWAAGTGWRGYLALRQEVAGLDYIALGLLLFPVAVLVSLGKAGVLQRWLAGRKPPGEGASG